MVGLQLNVSIVAIQQYAIYARILRFQGRSRPIFANNRYAIYQVQYRMTCKSVAILAQAIWPKTVGPRNISQVFHCSRGAVSIC